jgi:hypothetical protein
VLGLNVNVVRGYTGAAPMFFAREGGDRTLQRVRRILERIRNQIRDRPSPENALDGR